MPNGDHDTVEHVPASAEDLAAFVFDHLDSRELHPLMSDRGRQDAHLGAEVLLEAYGIGPIDGRREYVRASLAALQLIDEGFGPQLLAMLNAFADGVHRAPTRDLIAAAQRP